MCVCVAMRGIIIQVNMCLCVFSSQACDGVPHPLYIYIPTLAFRVCMGCKNNP